MIINMAGGGGGLKDTNAVLIVNVPTGSNVTAVKGVLSITPTIWAKSSDPFVDCAIFNILSSQFDSINPWIITATRGTKTVSSEILVTTNKEYELTLRYSVYIYNRGEINPITGGFISGWNDGVSPTRTEFSDRYYMRGIGSSMYGANGTTVTRNLINVTEYNTLCIVFSTFSLSGSGTGGAGAEIGLTSNSSSQFSVMWSGTPTPNEVVSLDISSISGNYYVGFGGGGSINITWEFDVVEFWFEY